MREVPSLSEENTILNEDTKIGAKITRMNEWYQVYITFKGKDEEAAIKWSLNKEDIILLGRALVKYAKHIK